MSTLLEQPPPPPGVIGPAVPPRTGLAALFGGFWPEGRRTSDRGDRRLLGAAVLVAVLAALVVPHRSPGAGLWVLIVAGALVVATTLARRARRIRRTDGGLGLLFLALTVPLVVTDAAGMVTLCLLAAYAVATTVLCRSRSVMGMVVGGLSVPLAWLRGLPWLRRSVPAGRPRDALPVARTAVLSLGLLAVLVGLFASADAVFAGWVDQLLPDLEPEDVALRPWIALWTAAFVLGGAYVGLNPPKVERAALPPGRPSRRFEWATPIAVAALTFAAFLLAQARALFGGHGYIERSTGLSYAEYVHQGFGQLVAATLIVVVVVGLTVRHASQTSRADRYLVRGLVGLLGALALVVVASALNRIEVYEEAYGFTFLRLMSSMFELWLGVVLVLATTVGVWRRARWVPKTAILIGIVLVGGLTLASPDAIIARHNVERHAATGRIDVDYVRGLSTDAVPALDRLPEPLRSCALAGALRRPVSPLSWNLSRARAEAILKSRPILRCPYPR